MSYQEEFNYSYPDGAAPDSGGGVEDRGPSHIDAEYFQSYGDLSVHRVMLDDQPRMAFYQCLMSDSSLVGNRVVVDVGAGTGLLGLWAMARGGAAHVISVEASGLAGTLHALYAANNLASRGHIIHSRVEDVIAAGIPAFLERFPWIVPLGGVDVVVSEWMGFYLLHECMLPSVLAARDFFRSVNVAIASAGGGVAQRAPKPLRLVPSEATLFVAPVNVEPWVRAKSNYWTSCVNRDWSATTSHEIVDCALLHTQSGPLNLELLGVLEAETILTAAPNPLIDVMPPAGVLRDAQRVAVLDLESCSSLQAVELDGIRVVFPPTSTSHDNSIKSSGAVHGFCFWFDVRFADRVLSTAPHSRPTHWKQTIVLLPEEVGWRGNAMELEPEDELVLLISIVCSEPSSRQYRIEVEIGE